MCLATICTTHPSYPFILISNRDEFLHRKTAPAAWWPAPHAHVLGGRDLQHPAHGTWLGVTRDGRLALLTNFREEGKAARQAARSRGELPKLFLGDAAGAGVSSAQFAERLVAREGIQELDGFSLIFGRMVGVDGAGKREALGIVSNRTPSADATVWVAGDARHTWGQTCALSNSRYGDRAWPKVVDAERLLEAAVSEHALGNGSEAELLDACFGVLGTDTLPPRPSAGDEFESYSRELRKSIFVPPIIADPAKAALSVDEAARSGSPIYGTQKQTVILVDRDGHTVFVERTLRDEHANLLPESERDRRFDFDIE